MLHTLKNKLHESLMNPTNMKDYLNIGFVAGGFIIFLFSFLRLYTSIISLITG